MGRFFVFSPMAHRFSVISTGEALQGLHFVHHTCSKAAGRLKRFPRIEWLGVCDIRIARAFCERDEECGLPAVLHQQRESLYEKLSDEGLAKLVPEHLEWAMPALAACEEDPGDAKILPRVLQFDEETGLMMNKQQVVVDDEEQEEDIDAEFTVAKTMERKYEDWRAVVFHTLSAAQDKFSNVLDSEMVQEDEGDLQKQAQKLFRVYRLGSHVHVQALEDIAQSKCVLVPSVMATTQITRKERKDIKNESKVILLDCPTVCADEKKVDILANPNRYPKKKKDNTADKIASAAKSVVIVAWAAKRSSKKEDCNMFKTLLPADEVLTLGDSDNCMLAASRHVTIPVYINSENAIKKGDEIVIYYEGKVEKPDKKEKAKTWRSAIPKKNAKR